MFGTPYREADLFGGAGGGFRRFQSDIDRMFNRAWAPSGQHFPPVNLLTREDAARITMEVSGMNPEDFDISLENGVLSIRGERKALPVRENERVIRQERSTGPFARSIRLPFKPDPDSVSASYNRGVLAVDVKRAKDDLPKKIEVKVSN